MFYVTSTVTNTVEDIAEYNIFDTYTHSTKQCTPDVIRQMIRQKFEFANLRINNGKITVNHWPNRLRSFIDTAYYGSEGWPRYPDTHINLEQINRCIMVCKYENKRFKLIDINNEPFICREGDVLQLIRDRAIDNCRLYNNKAQIHYYDVCNIHNDTQFVNSINKKYNEYIQKSALLGIDNSFEYTIENNKVILEKYRGTCKSPILPNFIHFIRKSAFSTTTLCSITLNNGLLGIGDYAFMFQQITELTIPKSVRFIGQRIVDNGVNVIR